MTTPQASLPACPSSRSASNVTRQPTSHINGVCRATFLDCFHCGNCVVTTSHLPRLLSLMSALARRRDHVAEAGWWSTYGPAWAAIRHDILPRFTPQRLAAAERDPVPDALLDLVEDPWARP